MSAERDEMDDRHRRVTRAAAEQIFDGVSRGAPPVGVPIAELLTAAVPRIADRETPGERSAVAAFRAARRAPEPAARTTVRHRRVTSVLAAKVIVAAAVLTGGGVAVADNADVIPRLFDQGTQHAVAPSRRPSPTSNAGSASAKASVPRPPTGSPSPPGSAPSTGLPPSLTLVSACRSYLDLSTSDRSKWITKHRYADLVSAAGGADRVDAYCAALLNAPSIVSTSPPSVAPSSPPAPSSKGHGSHPSHPPHPTHPAKKQK